MTLGIIGVGSVGSNLGIHLAEKGHEVVFGVRAGKDISEILSRCEGRGRAATPAEVVEAAEVIFLAVPAEVAVEAMAGTAPAGKIVVDCNNPVRWEDGPVWDPPVEGSTAAQLAAAYPEARWVKGFATFGAEFHRDPRLPDRTGDGSIDVHLAGDDEEAKARVAELSESLGYTVLDAGPLRNAAVLENLAVLWIHLAVNGGRGRYIGFKLLER
jgi:predicted dinucleotide-binding enzyme